MIKTEEHNDTLPKLQKMMSRITDESLKDILEYIYIKFLVDEETAHYSLLSLYSYEYYDKFSEGTAYDKDTKGAFFAYGHSFRTNYFSSIVHYDTNINTFLASSDENIELNLNSLLKIPLIFKKPKYKNVIDNLFEIKGYNLDENSVLYFDTVEEFNKRKPYLEFKMVSLDEFTKAILPVFKKDLSLLLKNRYAKLVTNRLDASSRNYGSNYSIMEIIHNNYTEAEFRTLTVEEKRNSIVNLIEESSVYSYDAKIKYDELCYIINHLIGDDYSIILNKLAYDAEPEYKPIIKNTLESLIFDILSQKETLTDLDKDTILNSDLSKSSIKSIAYDIDRTVVFSTFQTHHKFSLLQVNIIGIDGFITLIDDECKKSESNYRISQKIDYIVWLIISLNSSWEAQKNNLNVDDKNMSEQQLYKYVFSILEKNK